MATPRARPVKPDLRALDCEVKQACARSLQPENASSVWNLFERRNAGIPYPEVCLTRQSFILTAILKHDKARAIRLRLDMAAIRSHHVDFVWLGACGKYIARLFCIRRNLLNKKYAAMIRRFTELARCE